MNWRAFVSGWFGVAVGACFIFVAWAVFWRPEPAYRKTMLYDECLAAGRSHSACDAMMRVIAVRDRREACLAKADKNDPFAENFCGIELAKGKPSQ